MDASKGLSRDRLKIIAIIAMVIDHFAWGFVDFHTPLGQVLHIIGRLTLPIMCFFIAEGFRKTSDLKRYIHRMVGFSVVSALPFWYFFKEQYGYRQNVIFDLTLGLIMLTVLEHKEIKKPAKVVLAAVIFALSIVLGGWPITPILFILSFYYGQTFARKAMWFIISDVATIASLAVFIYLNGIYHFMPGIDSWVWQDKLYFLGFILALPLLKTYNGIRGRDVGGRFFFYVFYPAHFILLTMLRYFASGNVSPYKVYLGVHIICFIIVLVIMFLTAMARNSKGQSSVLIITFGGMIYVAGFILEVMADTVEGVHFACIVQYFGEYTFFIAFMYFVSILCNKRAPLFVYVFLTVVSLVFLHSLMHTLETGNFYRELGVDLTGAVSRTVIVYGPMFYISMGFLISMSIVAAVFCVIGYYSGNDVEKTRLMYVFTALVFAWTPYFLTRVGLTGGYEIPALGVAGGGVCMYLCLMRHGFLDSVTLASINALDHGREGILVVDNFYKVQYRNSRMAEIFGALPIGSSVRDNATIMALFDGKIKKDEIDHRIYDFACDSLFEGGFERGFMLWAIDSTDHYVAMEKIREVATRDPLTGLYNRNQFQNKVEEHLKSGHRGTMVMIDMDNFKRVNDENGHQTGDAVLNTLAGILMAMPDSVMICGRIGGDEFCGFIRGWETDERVGSILSDIMRDFARALDKQGRAGITSLSIGAVPASKVENHDFKTLYAMADRVLYEAKTSGKGKYVIYDPARSASQESK